jgi:hypothetical protein
MVRFHIWFLVVVLVGGPLAAGYFLGFEPFETEARRAAEAALQADVARTEAKVARIAVERIREAAHIAQKASIHEELLPIAAGTGNPLVARDRITGALERTSAPGDLVAVADVRGAILLRARAAGQDFTLPAFGDALRGMPRADLVAYKDTLYQVAVAPVMSGGQVLGGIAVGYRVGEWLERLRADAQHGLAVVAGGKIAASNLAPRERGELQRELGTLVPGKARTVALGGQAFLVQTWPVPGANGASLIHVRSEQAALATVDDLRLKYLYAAGGAFLVAIFWGFLLSRASTRPAQTLVNRIKAAGESGEGTVASGDLPSPWSSVALAASNALARNRARISEIAVAKAEAAAAVARATAEAAEAAEARAALEAARGEARLGAVPAVEAIEPTPVVEPAPEAALAPEAAAAPEAAEVQLAEEVVEEAPPPPAYAPIEEAAPVTASISFPAEATAVVPAPTELVRASAADDPLEQQLPALHQEFLVARRESGEGVEGVTFERFARKVRKIRDELKAQHTCDDVRFEVWVRGGRAALKAHPRKEAS